MRRMTRTLLTRLLAAPGMNTQHGVAERAARVIDQVIFDMGVDRLLQGTIQLDWRLRPCFHGCAAGAGVDPGRAPLATVALAGLSEAGALGAAARATDQPLHPYTSAIVDALVREFRAQSPRFRTLP
jgi:hypothetical protein